LASIEKRCRHPRADWAECSCTWYLRQRAGGRTIYTRLGPDRAKAERAAGRLAGEQGETMSEAIGQWLEAKAREPGARANSLSSYRGRAAHLKAYWGPDLVRSVRPEHMSRFVHDLLAEGYAPATVRGIYTALTGTLRHAARRGVIREVPRPVDGPGIPSAPPRRHELTLAEVEMVVEAMSCTWALVAELVLLTGLRWGEAVAIERGDIEGSLLRVRRTASRHGGVNPPKTRAGDRVVPLSPRAAAILADLDLPVGGDYRNARRALLAAMADLHQPGMGWHTLRAAHATLLDSAGVSLREAAARMGHGPGFAMTLAYRVRSEAGDAGELDRARERGST
jgi:integrase